MEKNVNEKAVETINTNPVFATIGDGYFFRQNDMRCFPSIASKGDCKDYLFRCVKSYNVMQDNQECFTWQGDLLRKEVPVSPLTADQRSADIVADYFRNALFVGSGPSVDHVSH